MRLTSKLDVQKFDGDILKTLEPGYYRNKNKKKNKYIEEIMPMREIEVPDRMAECFKRELEKNKSETGG